MFLYIDANAIVANPLLKGPQWDAVGSAAVGGVMDLYASELTVHESATRFRTVWILRLEGTAVSSGAQFDDVASLDLTSVDGDEDYRAPRSRVH